MANGWGGKRPGAGRPRGMMSRRNKALPIELRPRSRKPSAVFPREDFGRPAKSNFEMSAFELDAAIRRERGIWRPGAILADPSRRSSRARRRMSTLSDKQRAEWLAMLEAEHDRRQRKVTRQAEAADRQRDWFIDQIVQMGERLLAGPDITDLVTELMVANGDRQRIEAICTRADMSRMEACARIL